MKNLTKTQVIYYIIFSSGSFEKSALAQSVCKAFRCLEDPDGITGYVSEATFLIKKLQLGD